MKAAFSTHSGQDVSPVAERLRAALPDLSKQEARVAQFMLLNVGSLAFESGASIARKVGTSEITVSRLLRRLGYRGMAGLRRALQSDAAVGPTGADPLPAEGENLPYRDVLDLEMKSLAALFRQFDTPMWPSLVDMVVRAETVYVSGFQSVRGAAEDFARRLSLARDDVRFMAPHDSMLAEWLGASASERAARECLVMIDVVPYASEAEGLAELCAAQGRGLAIFTDEFCHWGTTHTDFVIHAQSRNGLFLESTGTLTAALNVLVHAVAEQGGPEIQERLERWRSTTRRLGIFGR